MLLFTRTLSWCFITGEESLVTLQFVTLQFTLTWCAMMSEELWNGVGNSHCTSDCTSFICDIWEYGSGAAATEERDVDHLFRSSFHHSKCPRVVEAC